MLLAGGCIALFGLILPTINGDDYKIGIVTIQIAVYAATTLLLAATLDQASRGRRIMLAILGAAAVLVVVWLISTHPLYIAYWKIRETPLYLFWLVAGALEIGATLFGGSRPTRRLELTSGVFSAAFGALILYLVNQSANESWMVGSFSLYFIALGVTWVLTGLSRRRATRAG